MIQKVWYYLWKQYIILILLFYFKERIVKGTKNIPKKGAVLLVSNHKNAMIDPVLIGTSLPKPVHFLTRASAFKIPLVKWLLSTINMMPIYRMRDGKESLSKNDEIFNKCYDILESNDPLLIFPEGTHDLRRWVHPLSKGFTRIVFGFLEKYPTTNLYIVPIGLNYTNATKFGESVSIYYGKPLSANSFYNENDLNIATLKIKDAVSAGMKELTTHIDIEHYDETLKKLGNVDFLDPVAVNNQIASLPKKPPVTTKKEAPSILWKFLKLIVSVNSIIPLLLYKSIERNIREAEFYSTTKFVIGATVFPLVYLLQSLIVCHFWGWQTALSYLIISILLVLLLAKTKRL